MLKNYIKIAFRNLKRFKGYTAINLTGLALGLTCGILIMLFVIDELSFDKFHTNYDRIYKVYSGENEGNGWGIGTAIKSYPEVESLIYAKSTSLQVVHEDKRFDEDLHFIGKDFFKIFSFNLIEGNPETALDGPWKMVLTEEMATKYFGTTDVLGKTLMLEDSLVFQISGVTANVPRQSHLQYDILLSFDTYTILDERWDYNGGWGNLNAMNYLLLKDGVDASRFEQKIANIYHEKIGELLEQMGISISVQLAPMSELYLGKDTWNSLGPKGSESQLYLVSAIALFVILLACINFINLTTARSVYRAKEVGLRKIVGSSRSSLFWQFLAESFVITLMAFLIVALVVDLLMPFFNELIGRSYEFSDLFMPEVLVGTVFMLLIITLLAGYYPAIVLSGFKPSETLKGKMSTGAKGVALRKGLVIFQFVISSVLVVGTLLVIDQLSFMREQDPGFAKEQVIVINGSKMKADSTKVFTFKNQLAQLSSVEKVSYTNGYPGSPGWQGQWATPEGFADDESINTEFLAVDADYLSTLGLVLIAGRNFDENRASDVGDGLLINETVVSEARWGTPENAIGKKITSPSGMPQGTVIGVVKNYHQEGLQHRIWPIVMDYAPRWGNFYTIRFSTGNTAQLVGELEQVWKTFNPDLEFNFTFLDEKFESQYRAEERLINVLMLFASVTVVIAVIGLFGLVSFMVVTRTKEIGVRKVLGASIFNITKLLSWQFLKLILVANIIIIPLVWYYGTQWLDNFAYKTSIDPVIFIYTTVISVGIALFTVSFQTIKAALNNPIDSLRTD